MAIIVKHPFVSTVPDDADTSIVRPSNWNADHTITGLGTAAELNAGVPNGVATLDSGGKVPVSELPAAVLGALNYQGTWNASTNSPTLTSSVGTKGYYYVVNVAGSTNLNGITDWIVGDWAVFNGTVWEQVDNTDAVTSVNGYTGTVALTQPDISGTVPTTETITAGTGLSGGGDLSAPRTISIANTGATAGTYGTDARTITQTVNAQGQVTNIFDQPISIPVSQINNLGTNVGTWLVTPTSANLAAAVTDETGSGALVFANSPTLSSPLIDSSNPYISFGDGTAVTVAAGRQWYNATTGSWNLGMGGGNITQQIGEELYYYGKASTAITDSPLKIVYQTGTVGASGTITFAPTVAGITNGDLILGIATENITLNAFGRITTFGVIHGITMDGSAYGETWADGNTIWYNPVTGNPTNVKPVAPNIKVSLGTILNAGSGGSGSFQVEVSHGSVLGGTDSNVQLTTPSAAQILTYDATDSYWKNTSLASGTGISVGTASNGVLTVTNSLPDQTVALANGTGISVTGTYPNFTITNTAPSSGGTVTSVSGTAGRITSTGGTTPVIDLASGVATAGTTGSSTLIPVVTIDTYGRVTGITTAANPQGTVTSVTGTAPVVSSGGATPAISMAAATGSVNGYLTSTDWTTFNGKAPAVTYTTNYVPYGQGTTTPALSINFTYDPTLKNLTAPQVKASNGIVVNSKTVSASYSIASGDCGMSVGPVTVASGQTVTVASGSRWVVL